MFFLPVKLIEFCLALIFVFNVPCLISLSCKILSSTFVISTSFISNFLNSDCFLSSLINSDLYSITEIVIFCKVIVLVFFKPLKSVFCIVSSSFFLPHAITLVVAVPIKATNANILSNFFIYFYLLNFLNIILHVTCFH